MEYPKVLTLGSYQTERALLGDVVIQEKVDGSNFRFWINPNGDVEYGSHHKQIHIGENYGMFKEAIEYLESIKDAIAHFDKPCYFFCEYLQKPKHNCLKYERCPQHNLVLFDIYMNMKWMPYDYLISASKILDIDVIPQFKYGPTSIDELRTYINEQNSYLGNEKIEGVVVKNYHEDIMIGGQVRPLFVKMVRPEFKEAMTTEQIRQGEHGLQAFLNSFRSEAKWNKAIQWLKENNCYTQSPKDIGSLIMRVHKDIEEEDQANIQEYLWKEFKRAIFSKSTAGLAEWYKEQLLKNLENTNAEGKKEGV